MSDTIHVVGQGLAGTLLGWELEKRGVPFRIYDIESANTGSKVGAGIINPVTGLRWALSWRVAELYPAALAVYRELEEVSGAQFLRLARVQRYFQTQAERDLVERRHSAGKISEFVHLNDDKSAFISPAARVDTWQLVARMRERWKQMGVGFRENLSHASENERVIRCTGAADREGIAAFGLTVAKGEILTLLAPELDCSTIINSGRWLLPLEDGRAKVGATYEREATECLPTLEARRTLEAFAATYVSKVQVLAHEVGLRVSTSDRLPAIGWTDRSGRIGLINGLGSKGALFAPFLAKQWADHLQFGRAFDPEVDVRRFALQLG